MRPGTHVRVEKLVIIIIIQSQIWSLLKKKKEKRKRNTLFGKKEKGEITSKTFEKQLMITVLKFKVSSISRYYQERYKN